MRKVLWVAVALIISGLLWCDTATSLRGILKDSQNTILPGAAVLLLQDDVVRDTTFTDSTGTYHFDGLVPGVYSVKAKYGAQTIARAESLNLKNGNTIRCNLNAKQFCLVVEDDSDCEYYDYEPVPMSNNAPSYGGGSRTLMKSRPVGGSGNASMSGVLSQPNTLSTDVSACCPRPYPMPPYYPHYGWNTENYAHITENEFFSPFDAPRSTFSIDVDRASYANMRRYLDDSTLPPTDAIRTEELVNYFDYDYPAPKGNDPLSIQVEISDCPWNAHHRLAAIGIRGRTVEIDHVPPANIVLLLDVSGSMDEPNKLPLVVKAMQLLVSQMRPEDHFAIVTYETTAHEVLKSTDGEHKDKILDALYSLRAGGSTCGYDGLRLAYQVADESYDREANNRIILCTDGDFNTGPSEDSDIQQLIEGKRKLGINISVLGFGTGNLKDSKLEIIADKGNGNYSYIDDILEAKRVLQNEFSGTMLTVAKDVKTQVEFNPAKVKGYRLIGYENRAMSDRDFNNDLKDAGDLGAGQTVTMLYEIIPGTAGEPVNALQPLRYQKPAETTKLTDSPEMFTLSLRYKLPDAEDSKLLTVPAIDPGTHLESSSESFRFASSVAAFSMLLRDSDNRGQADWKLVKDLANGALGAHPDESRTEYLQLVEKARLLSDHQHPKQNDETPIRK